ncbi:MAG: response regulator transcription factor [Bacteroidales bacterium]|nr:response regulator transcription factor [Bacteroidales bacterium]
MEEKIKTNRISGIFTRTATQMLYIFAIPTFFYAFSLIYCPMGIDSFYDMDNGRFLFNVTIITFLIFCVVFITRTIFLLLRNKQLFTQGWYIAWCALEFLLIAHTITLYTWFIFDNTLPYLEALTTSVKFIICTLWIPYLLIGLSLRLSDKNKSQKTAEENTRIRFYDERKNLKLVVLANNILYIEAEENYVRIYYTENGKTKDYLLRSSMKKIEELCQLNGLTRCHRSYFVNAAHVRVLAKDKDGFIYAELENLEKRIPVTKRYYENLSNLL